MAPRQRQLGTSSLSGDDHYSYSGTGTVSSNGQSGNVTENSSSDSAYSATVQYSLASDGSWQSGSLDQSASGSTSYSYSDSGSYTSSYKGFGTVDDGTFSDSSGSGTSYEWNASATWNSGTGAWQYTDGTQTASASGSTDNSYSGNGSGFQESMSSVTSYNYSDGYTVASGGGTDAAGNIVWTHTSGTRTNSASSQSQWSQSEPWWGSGTFSQGYSGNSQSSVTATWNDDTEKWSYSGTSAAHTLGSASYSYSGPYSGGTGSAYSGTSYDYTDASSLGSDGITWQETSGTHTDSASSQSNWGSSAGGNAYFPASTNLACLIPSLSGTFSSSSSGSVSDNWTRTGTWDSGSATWDTSGTRTHSTADSESYSFSGSGGSKTDISSDSATDVYPWDSGHRRLVIKRNQRLGRRRRELFSDVVHFESKRRWPWRLVHHV